MGTPEIPDQVTARLRRDAQTAAPYLFGQPARPISIAPETSVPPTPAETMTGLEYLNPKTLAPLQSGTVAKLGTTG